ncbi:MAG: hypothetical protein ACI8UO_003776 [Verrucomicrobiales bacterium]|jgi:hypothetical protein
MTCLCGLNSCVRDSELSAWRAESATNTGELSADLEPVAATDQQPGETGEEPETPVVPGPEPEPELTQLESIVPAVEVESKDGSVTLWLIDKPSGKRVQRLMRRASLGMEAKFSADQKYIVVSDQALSDLQTVHLFIRAGATSYRKVDRDAFTGLLWDQFAGEKLGPQFMITRYVTSFEGWENGGASLKLKLAALPREGEWIEKEYAVELAGL